MRLGLCALWWAALAALFGLTAVVLVHRVTWYLSVDQFGYLTFATDLRDGHVFHDWPVTRALADLLPPRTDALAQTYVFDQGRLYCRYAPGFPLLLAGWLALFGASGAHVLNPLLFIATLAVAIAFVRRLLGSRWRALLGGFLIALLPTMLHLWGLTLTRDISAHLMAFAALLVLVPWRDRRLSPLRVATAGLLLGFAISIRPDGALYLLPAGMLASSRWRTERLRGASVLAAASLGVAVGVAPLLAYDAIATGNPFHLTQSMEVGGAGEAGVAPATLVDDASGGSRVQYPSPVWRGGTMVQVNGGGLRLAHLPATFRGHLLLLRDAYGPTFLGLALLGAATAYGRRPLAFFVTVPYVLLALLFYGCWSRPDSRYLIGVHFFLILLAAEGAFAPFDLVRQASRRRPGVGRATAVAFTVIAALLAAAGRDHVPPGESALPLLSWLVPAIVGVGLLGAIASPRRRVVAVVGPVLALTVSGIGIARAVAGLDRRAAFQQTQVETARANVQSLIAPDGVVITVEDIGRPAENLEHYAGVSAVYLTDLERWRVPVDVAVARFLGAGRPVYLLLAADTRQTNAVLATLAGSRTVEPLRDVARDDAFDFFVTGPAQAGIRVRWYRVR